MKLVDCAVRQLIPDCVPDPAGIAGGPFRGHSQRLRYMFVLRPMAASAGLRRTQISKNTEMDGWAEHGDARRGGADLNGCVAKQRPSAMRSGAHDVRNRASACGRKVSRSLSECTATSVRIAARLRSRTASPVVLITSGCRETRVRCREPRPHLRRLRQMPRVPTRNKNRRISYDRCG